MTKQMKKIMKWELWIPIVLAVITNIVALTIWGTKLSDGQIAISAKLDEYVQRQNTLTAAVNKLETHMCQIDYQHGIECINGGQ